MVEDDHVQAGVIRPEQRRRQADSLWPKTGPDPVCGPGIEGRADNGEIDALEIRYMWQAHKGPDPAETGVNHGVDRSISFHLTPRFRDRRG